MNAFDPVSVRQAKIEQDGIDRPVTQDFRRPGYRSGVNELRSLVGEDFLDVVGIAGIIFDQQDWAEVLDMVAAEATIPIAWRQARHGNWATDNQKFSISFTRDWNSCSPTGLVT
ncbi:putative uncharacterized protein [Novosphingobium sp. PY1]|nr:putative uncharacterized protein [Novosphingobium sp. PY1]